MKGGLPRALVGCALGGALILIAQAVTWSRASLPRPAGGTQQVSVAGHDVASGLPAIGWALLALALALLAANGLMRRVVGALILLIGVAGIATAVVARGQVSAAVTKAAFTPPVHPVHASAGGWWVVAAIGGLLAALAGAAAVARGGRWGGLGARYETPVGAGDDDAARNRDAAAVGAVGAHRGADAAVTDDAEAWRALDRGEDPTAG